MPDLTFFYCHFLSLSRSILPLSHNLCPSLSQPLSLSLSCTISTSLEWWDSSAVGRRFKISGWCHGSKLRYIGGSMGVVPGLGRYGEIRPRLAELAFSLSTSAMIATKTSRSSTCDQCLQSSNELWFLAPPTILSLFLETCLLCHIITSRSNGFSLLNVGVLFPLSSFLTRFTKRGFY